MFLIALQSLGCTLYALAYSHSPFENTQTTEQGGSIAMAVLNARYKHPQSAYSQGLKRLIDSMLKVNPAERPDINEVSVTLLRESYMSLILFVFLSRSFVSRIRSCRAWLNPDKNIKPIVWQQHLFFIMTTPFSRLFPSVDCFAYIFISISLTRTFTNRQLSVEYNLNGLTRPHVCVFYAWEEMLIRALSCLFRLWCFCLPHTVHASYPLPSSRFILTRRNLWTMSLV